MGGIDDNRACRLGTRVGDDLPLEGGRRRFVPIRRLIGWSPGIGGPIRKRLRVSLNDRSRDQANKQKCAADAPSRALYHDTFHRADDVHPIAQARK